MRKIVHIAVREFLSTVLTRGFIIGVLVTPLMIAVMIILMPLLMNEQAPRIEGEIAVIDPSGEVHQGLADYLKPEAIAERRGALKEFASEQMQKMPGGAANEALAEPTLNALLGEVPNLDIVQRPADFDLESEKRLLTEEGPTEDRRLALIVVHEDAVQRQDGEENFGSYDFFVREKLDDRIVDEVRSGLRHAIVDARIRTTDLDRDYIEALTQVPRVRSTTVTEEGEKETNEVVNMLLPAGFMILLLVSVLTGGQYLLTTTIEEKSSRVVEVLLSAVSPMQLMTGKILGQMGVGLVILALYAGMGIVGLVSFALLGLVDLALLIYLLIFYVIAYFVLASMMAAIGAAVTEMREAQTLMTPVMVTLMIPWLLWLPITRNPNSIFATVTSFIPPINTFVMLLRMTSTSPPPTWQVWLCIAIGLISVWGALWFAAKVFRVGLLMFGKPPNFATLIKWVKMA
ncbi:MAG: ABC transporter permease [Thermoanaerobaculales bacterium]|nr:ABC transporter permease [Thermoanaerobaculales bacterium]